MKKILLLLFIIVMISTTGVITSAKSGLKLEVDKTINTQNQTIQVKINASENPGFCYLKLNVEYDSAIIKLKEVENGTITNGSFVSNAQSLLWDSAKDSTASGELTTLEFQIMKEVKNNDYNIIIDAVECYNIHEEEVNITGLETKESNTSEKSTTTRADKQNEKNNNEQLLEVIESIIKENGYPSISDIKSDNQSFVERVNKKAASIHLSQRFKTVDEIVNTYREIFIDRYADTVVEKSTNKEVNDVLQSALKKTGAKSLEELTPEQKKTFVEEFEKEMGKISGDIPVLSKKVDTHTAVEAIQKAVKQGSTEKTETESVIKGKQIWIFIGVGIILFVTIIVIFVIKKRKNHNGTSDR